MTAHTQKDPNTHLVPPLRTYTTKHAVSQRTSPPPSSRKNLKCTNPAASLSIDLGELVEQTRKGCKAHALIGGVIVQREEAQGFTRVNMSHGGVCVCVCV